jgi:hypothetical protein
MLFLVTYRFVFRGAPAFVELQPRFIVVIALCFGHFKSFVVCFLWAIYATSFFFFFVPLCAHACVRGGGDNVAAALGCHLWRPEVVTMTIVVLSARRLVGALDESSTQILAGPATTDALGQNFFVEGLAEEPPATSFVGGSSYLVPPFALVLGVFSLLLSFFLVD